MDPRVPGQAAAPAHLISCRNPGRSWRKGMARPVQYLDTASLTAGTVPVEIDDDTTARASIDNYMLTVDPDGHATVLCPAGGRITVVTRAA